MVVRLAATCYKLVLTFRRNQLILVTCLALINIVIIYLILVSNESRSVDCPIGSVEPHNSVPCFNAQLSQVTVVIRDFEEFENDLVGTVANLSSSDFKVVVVSDKQLYPPLPSNINLLLLQVPFGEPYSKYRLDCYVGLSKYVIIAPDAVRCVGRCIQEAVEFYEEQVRVNPTIALAVFTIQRPSGAKSKLRCQRLRVDAKQWSLQYDNLPSNTTVCDAVDGDDFVVLLKTETLFSFSSPFLRPLTSALFIQSTLHQLRVVVHVQGRVKFQQSRVLFETNSHNRWKHKQLEHDRLKQSYSVLGVKHVRRSEGRDEWYGCGKETKRCFGTVVNDVPEYIYAGRFTPPCCLRALRQTARYVFEVMRSRNIRYWLEGGTLLGAVRNGDIIPWDYDVDIGIYQDDIERFEILRFCRDKQEAYVDKEGYVWEKAREGDFYRVQYSQTNHLHVDIFPFFSRNGTMTKNTWFETHRQDTEFPESFVQWLEQIKFIGVNASIPNNAKQFLELKFGVGVIDNPRFPNDAKVSLSNIR